MNLNSVGGMQFSMPGLQRTPGTVQRPAADAVEDSTAMQKRVPQRTQEGQAAEAPARMMAEPRGLFVDCYA